MFRKKKIPPAYSLIEKGKRTVIVKNDWKDRLIALGITDPDFFLKQSLPKEGNYFGRGTVKIIALPEEANERIVIRHFQRGGMIRKLIPDIYYGKSRPLQELWVGFQAGEKRVPGAEIVAACHTRVFGRLHRGDLVTREIKDGKDLATYLAALRTPLMSEQILEKRKVIRVVGELVRAMHEAGIFHGDLNLKNIILQTADPQNIKGCLIDFDKSFLRPHLKEHLTVRNLLRFNRSAEKFKKQGLPITRTDVIRFLAAYWQNPPDLKARLKILSHQYKKHKRLHHWGKKISELF